VRDRISEIAAGQGRTFRQAEGADMPELLMRKLREEAAELLATKPGSPEEREEAADVLTVAHAQLQEDLALSLAHGKKNRERGQFFQRWVLVYDESEGS